MNSEGRTLTVREAHLILAATFLIYLGFSWLSKRGLIPGGPLIILIAGQMLLSVPGLIYMWLRRLPVTETLQMNPISGENVKMAVLVIICAYPLVGILNFLSMLFVENRVSGMIDYFLPYGLQISLVLLAFLPAFNEEILCRGFVFGSYKRVSTVRGIFLSALIFGLFHMNFNQMPYAFLLGIVFALMNAATGSLLTSMLMHFLLNGFNVLINFMAYGSASAEASQASAQTLQSMMNDPQTMKIALITILILVCAFVPMEIILIRKTFEINKATLSRNRGRLLDPIVLLFLAAAFIFTWKNTVFLF